MDKSLKENVTSYAIKKALNYLEGDPERNIPKLMEWVDRFDTQDAVKEQREVFHRVLEDKECNWYRLIMDVFGDLDSGVLQALFQNFIVNATMTGGRQQRYVRERYDCNVPWAILMDPTSACNLHCTGCWAAEYGDKLNLSYETMNDIIEQGKRMGTYMYIYSGGEPLVRKRDIIRLCEAHPDCEFLAFTNATLIDEEFADEMLRVKNFVPAISIEGYEQQTDSRRGAGTYQAVIRAMEILKRKRLLFGVSCCYTSQNTEVIGSEAYIDDMIERGAKFAWFFTYMPVGVDAVPELMVTAEQREYMYNQVREFRRTKPIFTLDFWNDGEYVNGCIAGGRLYMHINANGDIEPCAFIHYSDSNIHENTLLEAYRSPLFMEYHKNQPFNQNHLRPCPLLDNAGALAGMVSRSGAKSTDLQNPEDVNDLTAKCVSAADAWSVTADRLWCQHNCPGCAAGDAQSANDPSEDSCPIGVSAK